jgi:hypothetical protein
MLYLNLLNRSRYFLILLIAGLNWFPSNAQNFIPAAGSTTTINYPSGGFTHFYDPGGPGGSTCPGARTDLVPGNYPNCGCITQITIVPDNPSQPIEAVFTEFGIFANFDYLIVYDNNAASGTELYNNGAGGAQNNQRCPGPDTVRASNPSGALTFVFNATAVVDDAGFGFYIIENLPKVPNDAGISSIVTPKDTCPGTYNVDVQVENYGNNLINPVQINWSINGALQSPVAYNLPLDTANGSGVSKAIVNLGTVTLTANTTQTIKSWTSMPNNVADTVISNDSATAAVFGHPFPTIDLGTDTTICPGEPITLDGGLGRDSLRWSNNTTNPTLLAGTAGQFHVRVYENGCESRDTINVALFPQPPAVDFGPDTVLCLNTTLLLDATNTGVTYLWQDNSTNPTFLVNSPGKYSVVLEDANTCNSGDEINVTYYPEPNVRITVAPSNTLCFGAPVTFRAFPQTLGSIAYQWKVNGTAVGGQTVDPTFTGPVDHNDSVSVDLITDLCAAAPYAVPSNKIGMVISPTPRAVVGKTKVVENSTETYVVPLSATSSYLWQVSGGTINGPDNQNTVIVNWGTANASASITLVETDGGSCSRDNVVPVNVVSLVGIEDLTANLGLGDAYPNPSNDAVTIPVYAESNWQVELSLYDITGKRVKSIFSGTISGNKTIQFSVENLENGLYFYKLTTSDGRQAVKKLTIQH